MTPELEAKIKKIVIMVAVIIFIGMGIFLGVKINKKEKLKEELAKLNSTQESIQEQPIDVIEENLQQVSQEVVAEIDTKKYSEDNVVVVNLYPNMKKTSAKLYRDSKEREKNMHKAGIADDEYDVKFEETDLGVTNNIVAKRDNEFISQGEFLELVRTKNLMVIFK